MLLDDTLDSLAGLCVLFCEGPPLPLLESMHPHLHPSNLMVKSIQVFVSTTLFSLWILFTLIDKKDLGKTPLCPPPTHTPSTDPMAAEGRPFLQAAFVWSFFPFVLFPSQERIPT